ncbi:MAG: hypothetical protein ACREPW_04195 [Candidatus Binataceae bacterium]
MDETDRLTAKRPTISGRRLDRASAVGYTKASFFVPDEIPSFTERCAASARSATNSN